MSEFGEITVKLELIDAVSPILRSIETLIASGLNSEPVMPSQPIDILVSPDSTKATLVPSDQLIGLLFAVASDARQAAYAAIAEAQTAHDGSTRATTTN